MRMISFNEWYVAGSESNQRPLDPQSDSLSTLGDSAAIYTWAAAWQNQQNGHCAQRRHKSAWASALSGRPVWSVFAVRMKKHWDLSYPLSYCEDSDQIGRMPRLIWVFAGRKCHFVGFVMRWLTFRKCFIFANSLRNKPHFWRPVSLAQSTVSLTAEPRIAKSSPSPATYW